MCSFQAADTVLSDHQDKTARLSSRSSFSHSPFPSLDHVEFPETGSKLSCSFCFTLGKRVSPTCPFSKTHTSLFQGRMCACKYVPECAQASQLQYAVNRELRHFVKNEKCGWPFVDGQTRLRFQSKYVEEAHSASVVSLHQYEPFILHREVAKNVSPPTEVQDAVFDALRFYKAMLQGIQGVSQGTGPLLELQSQFTSRSSHLQSRVTDWSLTDTDIRLAEHSCRFSITAGRIKQQTHKKVKPLQSQNIDLKSQSCWFLTAIKALKFLSIQSWES